MDCPKEPGHAEGRGRVADGLRPGVGERARVGVLEPEQLGRLGVERGDEGVPGDDQHDDHHDQHAEQPAVEAPLLYLRVPAHAERDEGARDHHREQRDDERPGRGGEPLRAARRVERRPERLEELLGEHGPVDRRPQPEDEPPAGRGHHEPESAAEDAGLPHVVAAGPGDRDDEAAVGDDEERHPDAGDEDGREQLAVRYGVLISEFHQAQRDDVSGQAGVDHRVADRPAADQTGRFPQE